ncbi:MAG: M16 family metallopeptidase [Gemmatimonas sp.]|uniref:M16 family metallopeptidase n=1 Tax=Gemmatimonas sp. TaxID=1962908 RepID=UPI00391F866F
MTASAVTAVVIVVDVVDGTVVVAIGADASGAEAPTLHRTDLPNGLTVLSEAVPGARSVAFGAWVRAATLHERPEVMGVSHLLEHMVFKGTRTRSAQEIALSLETLGGALDAYTEREHTSYQARVLDEHLETAAEVIGELIFHPLLRPEDLALERKVILEEISMVDDTPDDIIFDVHNRALWGDHPHGYAILGTRETVKALDVSHLRALHTSAYHPGRVVVAASGRVEHEQLLQVLQRTGWLDEARGDCTPFAVDPVEAAGPHAEHVKRKDIGQVHVVLGGPGIAHGDPRRYAFALIDMLLGGGMSSRLFQRVREELGLAYSVHSFSGSYADTGSHGVYLASAPDSAQEALDAVRDVLREVARRGLTGAELAAGKRQRRGQLVLSMEGVSSRMYRAATTALYGEPYRTIDELMALVDAIDEDQVREVARDFFDPDRHILVSLGPKAVR